MTKYLFSLLALSLVVTAGYSNPPGNPLSFEVINQNDDPGLGIPTNPRGSVIQPEIAQDGHTLYLYSGCDNATLVLLDENGDSVYSTAIVQGTTQIVLPSHFVGEYELRIFRDGYVFYTIIELE